MEYDRWKPHKKLKDGDKNETYDPVVLILEGETTNIIINIVRS